ncbi:MAG: nucleotide-binding universal stress UspA family protein [Myxococcota bacterium]|jgi:nucleotide-binding universal stress UspA family protein
MSYRFRTDLGPFRAIVHPTDFAELSESAFLHALAVGLRARARLVTVHVAGSATAPSWELFAHVRSRIAVWGALAPDATQNALEALGMSLADTRAIEGEAATVVRDVTIREQAELIVLGTHAGSGWRRLRGSLVLTPELQKAGVPTLIHREGTTTFIDAISGRVRLRRVLVPVDETPSATPALEALFRLFDSLDVQGASIRLFHVGPEGAMPPMWPEPQRDTFRFSDGYGSGAPARAIAAEAAAWDADLIAMTTGGRRGLLDAVMGSTVERVVAAAPCPVLAVPSPPHRALRG